MKITEETIKGEIYTITETDSGHVIRELKMTEAQKAKMYAHVQVAAEKALKKAGAWSTASAAVEKATTIADIKSVLRDFFKEAAE